MQRAVLLLIAAATAFSQPQSVLESSAARQDFELNLDPNSPEWRNAPRVALSRDYLDNAIPGQPTEVRSRWTADNLYLFYICPYVELNLKPAPDPKAETDHLWDWEVAEAFIGSDYNRIAHYKEFQVSPQGEWVDLDIDREDQSRQQGVRWNSGFSVSARIGRQAKIWYGAMRIPWKAIDSRPAQAGRELRIGLYRIAGRDPNKNFYAWRPTGSTSFHVPKAFGTLRLK